MFIGVHVPLCSRIVCAKCQVPSVKRYMLSVTCYVLSAKCRLLYIRNNVGESTHVVACITMPSSSTFWHDSRAPLLLIFSMITILFTASQQGEGDVRSARGRAGYDVKPGSHAAYDVWTSSKYSLGIRLCMLLRSAALDTLVWVSVIPMQVLSF